MSCAIKGCDKPVQAVDLCTAHYTRLRRYGSPTGSGKTRPRGLTRVTYFERKVLKLPGDDGCWEWQGKIANSGYGQFAFREGGAPKSVFAHRFAYETYVGPIPDGLLIDHTCRNKRCVRPDHLEPVTPGENNLRHYSQMEFCKRGHPMTPDNVYVPPKHPNQRKCKECRRRVSRQNWLRKEHPETSLPL